MPAAKLLAGLGVEPFDPSFDGAYLHAALRRRRVAVKQALLGGAIVVGAGNIYACEALFEARHRPAHAQRPHQPAALRALLAEAVRATLARAVELGGSTLRDFRDAHGVGRRVPAQGASVYGRAGKPCLRCGDDGAPHRPGARATFFCPGCQRR